MNGKPDETLDQWVRQTLDQLPDAPPPGSAFDAERLWSQLRPELTETPGRRWTGWVRWVAAACIIGCVLSWFWLTPPPESVAVTLANVKATPTSAGTGAKSPDLSEVQPITKPNFTYSREPFTKRRLVRASRSVANVKSAPPITQPGVSTVTAPEPSVADETTLPVASLTEPTPKSAVAIASKRRFRVVHENEIRAEEETRSKLYRTEGFVRLGTGRNDEPVRDEPTTGLILPLTNKTNQ